jgi:DNA-binding transcriptional LysR family regulator
MLNVNRLMVFAEVIRTGSFSAAGDSLGCTQSAVSQQVARLEHELGLTLFERCGRRCIPTAIGLNVAHEAERLRRILDDVQRTIDGMKRSENRRRRRGRPAPL